MLSLHVALPIYAGKAWIAVDLLTKAEILAEIELLTAKQRGFGRPTFLLVTAFFVVLVGAIVSIAGGISLFLGAPIVTLVAAILGIADALAVVANQNRYGYRIGELKRRREALDSVTRAPFPGPMCNISRP